MRNPVRDQIRLGNQWQVRSVTERSASFFVPVTLREKQIMLESADQKGWTRVSVDGHELQPPTTNDTRSTGDTWSTDEALRPGAWNQVEVDGRLSGARLTAVGPLHIASLQATFASRHSISVRLRLSGESSEVPTDLLTVYLSVSGSDGRQIGGTEVTLGRKSRALSIEVPLPETLTEHCRLKASLCIGETVVDNARIDVDA